MTSIFNRAVRTAALGAFAVAGVSVSAVPAQAQNEPEWQDVLGTALCIFAGRRVPASTVSQNASSRGYTNIRNVEFRAQQHPNIGGCGYYRLLADRNGNTFRLFARSSDGQIAGRQRIGGGNRDRINRAELNEDQIRRALRRQGYRNIDRLRYVSESNGDWYEGRAEAGNRTYRLIIDDQDGKVVERQIARGGGRDRPNRADMTEEAAYKALRDKGYRGVSNIDYVKRGNRDFYQAYALSNGKWYQVRVEDSTGEVMNRRESRRWTDEANRAELNPKEVHGLIRRQGYRKITDVDYVKRGNRDFYTADAHKGGKDYRLRVDDYTGKVLQARAGNRDRPNRADLSEAQITKRLEAQGYNRIRRLRYFSNSNGDFYEGVGNAGGKRYALLVEDSSGKVLKRELAERSYRRDLPDRAEADERDIRRHVRSKGYNVDSIKYISRYGSDWYEVRARTSGRAYTLIVTDHNPRIVTRF